jgi:hypothetical protein
MSQARLNEGTGAEAADPRWEDLYRIGETTCVLVVGWWPGTELNRRHADS